MSTDFPIVIPPKQNTDAEIMHRATDQKNVGFFQRRAVASLMASLNDTLQDAAMEICLAPSVYMNPGKFRMMNYGRVSGMGPADLSAYMLDMKKKYEEWCRLLMARSPMALSICKRVCQEEHSLDVIRKDERISEKTALRLLQYGLNEYSIIAGWGDQIEINK